MTASVGRSARTLGGLLSHYRYAVSALDQVAISLLNFGLTFALVRALPAPQFGTVALWLTLSNLPIAFQAAIVLTPLSVYAPAERDEVKRRRLEEALASANLLVTFVAVLTIVCINAVSDAEWVPQDWIAWAAIPLFVGTGMYRQYARFFAFSRADMTLLLLVDVPYFVMTAALVLAMLVWPQHLASLAGAFAALAIGSLAGGIGGGLRMLRHRLHLLRQGWTQPYRPVFGEIMWSLAGVVSSHLQERSYVYVTTSIVGLAQLGTLNAIGMLFRPAQIVLTGWRRSATPEFAMLLSVGRVDAVYRQLLAASVVALAGCGVWFAVLWLGWRTVDHYLLAGKYSGASVILLPWAVATALDAIQFIVSTALQAAREFRYLAWVMLVTAPVAIAGTVGLTWWNDYTWTIYGLAIGNGLAAVMIVARLAKVRSRLTGTAPTPTDDRADAAPIG